MKLWHCWYCGRVRQENELKVVHDEAGMVRVCIDVERCEAAMRVGKKVFPKTRRKANAR